MDTIHLKSRVFCFHVIRECMVTANFPHYSQSLYNFLTLNTSVIPLLYILALQRIHLNTLRKGYKNNPMDNTRRDPDHDHSLVLKAMIKTPRIHFHSMCFHTTYRNTSYIRSSTSTGFSCNAQHLHKPQSPIDTS